MRPLNQLSLLVNLLKGIFMRNILVISIAATALLSSPTFAYEIYKGKVTQHKEWATGGAKGKFVTTKKSLFNHRDDFSSTLSSSVQSSFASVNTPINVKGTQFLNLWNATEEPQSYNYFYELCAKDELNLTQCINYYTEVTLEPNGSFWDDTTLGELEMSYSKPGTYDVSSFLYYYGTNYGGSHSFGSVVVS